MKTFVWARGKTVVEEEDDSNISTTVLWEQNLFTRRNVFIVKKYVDDWNIYCLLTPSSSS